MRPPETPTPRARPLLRALAGALAWLLVLLAHPAHAQTPGGGVELRVAVERDARHAVVGASVEALVSAVDGSPIGRIPGREPLLARASRGLVELKGVSLPALWIDPGPEQFVYTDHRWYRGRLLIVAQGDKLLIVNYVDLEHYLYSVVGAEMSDAWPLEALKAQAVAARSYALHRRAKSLERRELYDLGATARWQVYRGIAEEGPATRQAVAETAGLVLTFEGKPIFAAFHSSSGGHTEAVEHVWGGRRLPYLRAVQDFDQGGPVYEWQVDISERKLRQALKTHTGDIGRLISITPVEVTPRRHVITARVVGTRGEETISGRALRAAMDLRSTRFIFGSDSAGPRRAARNFRVVGRGFGHAVGMSQWGALSLAKQGYTFQQILGHYYRNTIMARVAVGL